MTMQCISDIQGVQAHNQAIGAAGETLAKQHLLEKGFRLLAENWRCRYGELDLIMRDGNIIVCVEVKTRSNMLHGSPLEAITVTKANRLRKLLLIWARENNLRGRPLRIDAVGIVLRSAAKHRIDHLRGIA